MDNTSRAYRQVVRYLSESPWAIHLPMLHVIRDIVELRLDGVRLSDEEIEQRVSGGRQRPSTEAPQGVAVVPLWGVLVPHAGMMIDVSTPGTGLDAWLEDFRAAVADPQVRSVLLYVDSPGGSADLVTETAAEVRAARAQKEIVAVASTMAASAAYAIFAQATTAVVTPSGQVGSIGVYTIHQDVSAALEKEGVKPTVIQAPKDGYKTERQPFGPLSEEAQAHLQEMVDSYYRQFVADVAKGRGISASEVEANYGRGRVLTAEAALAAGMVDGIATFDQVLSRMVAGKPVLSGARQLGEGEPVPQLEAARPVRELAGVGAGAGAAVDTTAFYATSGAGGGGGSGGAHGGRGMPGLLEPEAPAAAERPGYVVVGEAAGTSGASNVEGTGAPGSPGTEHEPEPEPEPTHDPEPEPEPTAEPEPDEDGGSTSAASTTNTPHPTEGGTDMEPVSTTGSRPPTLEELAANRDSLAGQMAELDDQYAGRLMDEEAKGRFDELAAQHTETEATMRQIRERKARLESMAKGTGGSAGVVPGAETPTWATNAGASGPDNIYDLAAYRQHARSIEELASLWRDGALRANEQLQYATAQPDRVRAFVEQLLVKEATADPSESFAHRMLLTANPAYDAAFGKLVMGRPLSTSEESLVRMAVSNTGLGGETPVPVTIDPSVILTSDGQSNPLRRISRTVTITGNKWRGISSDGVSVVYEAELATVADQTPDFDAPEAEVEKAHGWVEFSIEVDQDWPSFRSELATMFQDARDAKEAEKFLLGTGTNEPEGLLFALIADGGSIIESAATNTFALTDLDLLVAALPPRYDARARWLTNKTIYGQARSLARAEGTSDVWVPLAQGFPNTPDGATQFMLLGYPADVASNMSKLYGTGGEEIAILGDFSRGFLIVDRVGLNVEIMPLVPSTGGRPRGSRGMYVYFRNTSKLLNANAFRVLRVKAS